MNNPNQKQPYILEEDSAYLPIQVDNYLSVLIIILIE